MALSNNLSVGITTSSDTSGVDKTNNAIKNLGSSSENSGLSFGKMSLAVAAGQAIWDGAQLAISKVSDFLSDSVNAWNEAEAAMSQTESVLRSTNGAAGVTAQQVTDLATAFEWTTPYADEVTQSAENMLLTFTNISKDVFPQTTQAVLDMATAMGSDLKSTAIQVGKALQDPILGATALQRVGVRLTESQKDLIKSLVDAGDAASAQKVILKELETEFGGSAEAAGSTFAGQLSILKNKFGNLQEAIGQAITNGIKPFIQTSLDWFDSIGGVDGIIKKVTDTFKPFINGVIAIAKQIGDYLIPKLNTLWTTIKENVMPFLQRMWKEILVPMAQTIGVVLVGAIGAAIDVMNFLGRNISIIVPILAGAVIGFTTYSIIMKTLSTITAIQTAAQNALNTAMLMNPYAVATAAIAGLVLGFSYLVRQNTDTRSSTERLTQAQKDLTQSQKDAKDATDKLHDANYNLEGAQIAVITAQDNVKAALDDYGKDSIQYRMAVHEEQGAEDELAAAKRNVANATQLKIDKDNIVIANVEKVKAANTAMKQSANDLAAGYNNVSIAIDDATKKAINSKSNISVSTLNAITSVPGSKIAIPKYASGTDYAPGGLSLVGENGPELVNLPKGSQVKTSSETNSIMNSRTVTIGTIILNSASAAQNFFDNLDNDSILVSKGMSPVRGIS